MEQNNINLQSENTDLDEVLSNLCGDEDSSNASIRICIV